MNDFSITVEINAPPERVWDVMSSVEQWPEWTPSVRSIRRLKPGPLGIGSRVLIHQPKLPPAIWKITELHPGHNVTWITHGIGVKVTARHSVMPSTQGSVVTLSVQFQGILAAPTAWMTKNINNTYLNLEATSLKRHCESRL